MQQYISKVILSVRNLFTPKQLNGFVQNLTQHWVKVHYGKTLLAREKGIGNV